MKVVIEISEEEYNRMKEKKMFGNVTAWENAICNGTPLDSIITDIEVARDKDKLCEYPYVRCVEIIKKAMGHEEKTMDEGNK